MVDTNASPAAALRARSRGRTCQTDGTAITARGSSSRLPKAHAGRSLHQHIASRSADGGNDNRRAATVSVDRPAPGRGPNPDPYSYTAWRTVRVLHPTSHRLYIPQCLRLRSRVRNFISCEKELDIM